MSLACGRSGGPQGGTHEHAGHRAESVGDGTEVWTWAAGTGVLWGLSYSFLAPPPGMPRAGNPAVTREFPER